MISAGRRRGTASTWPIPALLFSWRWLRHLRPLLPSFVADAVSPDHRPAWRLRPTSYLDGLRGIAAVIVFFCHYTENNFPQLTASHTLLDPPPPGSMPAPDPSPRQGAGVVLPRRGADTPAASLLQLPFLRLVFSGRPMVHIFFVISGFALSHRPLTALLRHRSPSRAHAALASSALRRAPRLLGPPAVSTLLVACLRRAGWLAHPAPPPPASWPAELAAWARAFLADVVWPWAWDRDLRPRYDVHLWTVPIEFAHSMLLFVVLLALAGVRRRVRGAAVVGLMGYCLACGRWAAFEFLAGLGLAEVHIADTLEGAKEMPEATRAVGWARRVVQVGLVVFGSFVAGWPNRDAERTPGIRHLLAWTPPPFATADALAPQKFWFALSAVGVVWAVGELGFLRRRFESPLAQYCGRVSYAVYLCHGPVEDLFRRRILGHAGSAASGKFGAPDYRPAVSAAGVKGLVGTETTAQIAAGWFVGLCFLGPLVIWAADLFWRGVDAQMVSLARKLEAACVDDSEPSPGGQGYSVAA